MTSLGQTERTSEIVFTQHGETREVREPAILRRLEKSLEHNRRHDFPG